MYFRDIETDKDAHARYNAAMKAASAKRMSEVAAKLKLKREAKRNK
jgi:hypothetical protein